MVRNTNLSVLACRVCLSLEKNNVIMDTGNGLLELFTYCFGLEINPREQARALCEQCADSLKSFALLKVKCLESDDVWKSRLKELQFKMQLENDTVAMETAKEECLTESEELKENDIVEQKKENDTFETDNEEYLIESGELKKNYIFSFKNDVTHCPIEPLDEFEDDIDQKASYSYNDKINEICVPSTGNISKSIEEVQCGCGLKYIDNKANYKMHIKKCSARRFYNLPENRSDVLKTCGLCEFSAQDAKVICQHFDEHYKRNNLDCKLCDYTGQDFAEMAFHRYKHMSTKMSKLHCLKCLSLFLSPKGLQFHFRRVHLKKEKGGLCFCGNSFATVKSWRKHEKTKHYDVEEGINVFICDCCGLKFRFRNEIVSHLRTRAGLNKVVCAECGAVFNRQSNLTSHIKNKHTKKERIKCPKCPKTLSYSCFQGHMGRVHGDKNYFCELCSAAYTTLKSLNYHMLEHTKERPHQCDICNASYKNKAHLTLHIRKHTGDRPYVCSVCCKGFVSLNRLKIHNSVHTSLRRHQCEACDRSFHGKKQLLEHCAKAHPEI